jgi:hypothetical protein
MARQAEFTKDTKRQALRRAQNRCEASGARYGLNAGQRCGNDLAHGVIFDHDNPEANSKDASLENCRSICPACNRFKTGKTDIPMIAKTVRQQDKGYGIRKSATMPGSRNSRWKKLMNGSVVAR